MTRHEDLIAVVDRYIAAFDQGDADAVVALFAADARVEDPAGSPPHVGRDAIRAFYAGAMRTGAKLTLDGPVRTTADSAAFAFHVDLMLNGAPMRIDVIDVFRFAPDGTIATMHAYFGPNNMHIAASSDDAAE